MRPISTRAVPATAPDYGLAESPVWDERSERLYWVDIPAGAVLEGRLVGDEVREERRWHRTETVSAVCPAEDGSLLVAGADALHRLHPEQGWQESGPALIEGPRRLNDGASDPAGRYVVGSLDLSGEGGDEVLLHAASASALRTGVGLSNGIDWSPDGTTIYHVDSTRHTLSRADYDVASGTARHWSTLFEVTDSTPDGLALDADGLLWIACWGAGEARRYDHEGRIHQVVTVDAPLTSSLAFAGDELAALVITTARDGLPSDELAAAPASGSLFVARPGVAGRRRNRWAGGLASRPVAGATD